MILCTKEQVRLELLSQDQYKSRAYRSITSNVRMKVAAVILALVFEHQCP